MSKDIQLQNAKLELIKWLTSLSDTKIIERLLSIKKEAKSDFWDELTKEEQAEIQRGIAELNEGKRISLDDFLKKVNKDV